jgi:hypothetical protein
LSSRVSEQRDSVDYINVLKRVTGRDKGPLHSDVGDRHEHPSRTIIINAAQSGQNDGLEALLIALVLYFPAFWKPCNRGEYMSISKSLRSGVGASIPVASASVLFTLSLPPHSISSLQNRRHRDFSNLVAISASVL